MLLLASLYTKNDKTGIHEQMYQRMGDVYVARRQSAYRVAGWENNMFDREDAEL